MRNVKDVERFRIAWKKIIEDVGLKRKWWSVILKAC